MDNQKLPNPFVQETNKIDIIALTIVCLTVILISLGITYQLALKSNSLLTVASILTIIIAGITLYKTYQNLILNDMANSITEQTRLIIDAQTKVIESRFDAQDKKLDAQDKKLANLTQIQQDLAYIKGSLGLPQIEKIKND